MYLRPVTGPERCMPDVVQDDDCTMPHQYMRVFPSVERALIRHRGVLDLNLQQLRSTGAQQEPSRRANRKSVKKQDRCKRDKTYNERLSKLLSGDKGMQPCLLRSPSRHRIQIQ
jgi:hypothetical protein